MVATERLALLVAALLGCSEGGLLVAEPTWDDGDEGESSSDGSESELDEAELDGELDEGSTDGTDGPSDVFVAPGDVWHYQVGPIATADWATPGFDASAWSSGSSPLGNSFADLGKIIESTGPSARFRAEFEVADPSAVPGLELRLRRDDGAIAYLNGVEIMRVNLGAGVVGATDLAASESSGLDSYRYHRGFAPVELLQAGSNVLAIEIHDDRMTPVDRVMDAMLRIFDPALAPEMLEFRIRTIHYDGEYGPSNVGAIWIERQDGSFVRTLKVWGDVRREHLITWRISTDENDVDAETSSTLFAPTTHVVEWDLLDASGQIVGPGLYRIRVEFTEDDSNDGAPAGPLIEVPFEIGGEPDLIEVGSGDVAWYADLQLWGP